MSLSFWLAILRDPDSEARSSQPAPPPVDVVITVGAGRDARLTGVVTRRTVESL